MNRGRKEKRSISVFPVTLSFASRQKWRNIRTVIVVKRTVLEKQVLRCETAYFVSDLSPETKAKYFYAGIRTHWNIEAFHYIKDVTFKEDASKVRTGQAPQNYSLLRNFAINIFREHGLNCIQAALEKCANNIPFMLSMI